MKSATLKSVLLEVVLYLLGGLLIFGLIQTTLLYAVVDGSSMEPTLHNAERLLVSKLTYRFGDPQRGDVIIFPPPAQYNTGEDFVKRIIGLPGDTVEIKTGGTVYINGQALSEPYVKDPALNPFPETLVPEGSYFVLGDNRNDSLDSRYGFFVSRADIRGKVWLSVWPLSDFGTVSGHLAFVPSG